MTQENLEKMYSHFRDLEKNYVAPPQRNTGLTATDSVIKTSKKSADDLLEKFPDLAKLDKVQEELKEIDTPGDKDEPESA